MTRHWNHRDCDGSALTAATRDVVFLLERVSAVVPISTLVTAQQRLIGLVAPHAERVFGTCIDEETPLTALTEGEPGLTI